MGSIHRKRAIWSTLSKNKTQVHF